MFTRSAVALHQQRHRTRAVNHPIILLFLGILVTNVKIVKCWAFLQENHGQRIKTKLGLSLLQGTKNSAQNSPSLPHHFKRANQTNNVYESS